MRPDDDLAGLDERELLDLVVRELRAVRRLIGTIAIVVIVLGLLGPAVVALAASV